MAVTAEIAPRVSAGIAARTVSTAGVGGDATGIGGSGALRLLDHLIGGRQQRFRDGEAEGLGGFEIDDELELGRLLDRQGICLFAAENAAGITAEEVVSPCEPGSIAH